MLNKTIECFFNHEGHEDHEENIKEQKKENFLTLQQVDDRREEIPYSPEKKRGKLRVSGELKRTDENLKNK